jgi:hypothetical protein
VLNVGEHMAVPVVRHLLAGLQESRTRSSTALPVPPVTS